MDCPICGKSNALPLWGASIPEEAYGITCPDCKKDYVFMIQDGLFKHIGCIVKNPIYDQFPDDIREEFHESLR